MSEQKSVDRKSAIGSLVSVVVITYNSARYVLETLKSINVQSYKKLELIISDDCSSDDTVEVCRRWMEENRQRFVRTELITSAINTGIPANGNRAIKAARGEWIKGIAGDDLLTPECITNLMLDATIEKDIIVGYAQMFRMEGNRRIVGDTIPVDHRLFFFDRDSRFQHHYLLTKSFNFAPCAMIRRELYNEIGYLDERFQLLDDLPFWLKATGAGYKIWLADSSEPCVLYRTGHESCSFSRAYRNPDFYRCIRLFYRKVLYKEIPFWNIVFYQSDLMHFIAEQIIMRLLGNRRTHFSMAIDRIFDLLCLRHYIYPLKNYCYRRGLL